MTEPNPLTFATVSLPDRQSMSIDIADITNVTVSRPVQASEAGSWFSEVIIRSTKGVLSLQLLSDDPEKLSFTTE